MQTSQIVAELSRLFAVEIDAIQAYSAALPLAGSGPIREEIALFRLEHQRHAVALQQEIVRRGHRVPDVEPDVKGVVIGALSPPRRALTVEDVLAGLRGNEQLTGTLYAKALARNPPDDVRELLEGIRADEERHLRWVERALSLRAWEASAAAP
jgi:rubrerythrin